MRELACFVYLFLAAAISIPSPSAATDGASGVVRVGGTPAELRGHVQTLRDRSPKSSSAIIQLRLAGDAAVAVAPDLMRMCDSLETHVRCDVISLVAQMNLDAETRLEFLLDRVDDPERAVSKNAWGGVTHVLRDQSVQYRRDEVIDRLAAHLNDDDPQIRISAARMLASIKAINAVPDLQSAASADPDALVRKSAARAIDTIEGRGPCCRCEDPIP